MGGNIEGLSFCDWLIPHSIMSSKFMHVVACERILFVHESMDAEVLSPFGCCEQFCYRHGCTKYLWDPTFNSFGFIPRSGIVGLYSNFISNFLRDPCTVFHSGFNRMVPISLHACLPIVIVFLPSSLPSLLPCVSSFFSLIVTIPLDVRCVDSWSELYFNQIIF